MNKRARKKPRAAPEPHLFLFLKRQEFRLAFAIAFIGSKAAEYKGAFGLSDFASPNCPDAESGGWYEEIARACRYLHSKGFAFEGLHIDDDGAIRAYSVIEPGNDYYRQMFALGHLPHIPSAIETAIALIEEHKLDIDLDILRGALADVTESIANLPPITPEEEQAMDDLDELKAEAMQAAGFTMLKAPKEVM